MKKLTGLVIILAVLILGGYYGMGVLTERAIRKNMEVVNQSNGLVANIEEYHRGWFSSDAKINWSVHVPERVVKDANGQSQTVPAQNFQMAMPLKVYHGPFIFTGKTVKFGMGYGETVFNLPEQYSKEFDNMFTKESVKPHLDMNIFVSYLSNSSIGMNVPAFKLIANKGNGQFDWLGMTTNTEMTANMNKVEGDIAIDGMNINKDDTKITLGKVSSEYDLHKTDGGLYLGDASFELPSFVVDVKGQKMLEVQDFSLSSNSEIDDKLFNAHFNSELKGMLINGQAYGPGEVEVSIRNLDADVLASINQQAAAMQNGTDAQRQQAMMAMLPEIPKLFSKGAEFEISKLSMKLPQGTVDGNLLITLPAGDSNNPFELIQKIQGNGKFKVPSVIVKQLMQQSVMQQMTKQPEMQQALMQQLQTQGQADQAAMTPEQLAAMQADKQIGSLEQSGLVMLQGSDYVMEFSLEQGKFTINGKPFDPAMLKFLQ